MLTTMYQIWPGAKTFGAGDLSGGGGLKKAYLQALRQVHPDKVDNSASAATKAKAQRIFTTLQNRKPF